MRNLWSLFVVGLATGFISEQLLVSSQASTPTAEDLYFEGRTLGDFPIDDEDRADAGSGSGSGSGDYAFSDVIDKDEILRRFFNFSGTTFSKETLPKQPQPTEDSHHDVSTRADVGQDPSPTVEQTEAEAVDNREEEVPGFGPTADWFPHDTSPSSTSRPPSETTAADYSMDVTTEEERILGSWDEPTVEYIDDTLAFGGQGSRMMEPREPEEVTSENMWERTEVLAAVIACGVVGFLCAVFLLLLLAYRMKKKDEGSYDLGDTKLPATAYHKAPTKEFYA